MIVHVLYVHADGTVDEETHQAPRISVKTWGVTRMRTGRALIKIRDRDGRLVECAFYSAYTRIRKQYSDAPGAPP